MPVICHCGLTDNPKSYADIMITLINAGYKFPSFPGLAAGSMCFDFNDSAGLKHIFTNGPGRFNRGYYTPPQGMVYPVYFQDGDILEVDTGYLPVNYITKPDGTAFGSFRAIVEADKIAYNDAYSFNYALYDVSFDSLPFYLLANESNVNTYYTVGDTKRIFQVIYNSVSGAAKTFNQNIVTLASGRKNIFGSLGTEAPAGGGWANIVGGAGSGTCGFDSDTKQKIVDIYNEVVPVDFTPLTDKMDEFLLKIDDALLYAEDFKTSLASIPARLSPSDVDNIADRLAPADEDVKEGLTEIKDKIALDNENFKTSFEGRFDQTNLQLSAVVGAICALMSKDKRSVSQLIFDGEYKNADNLVTKNITFDSAAINQKLGEIVKTLCRFMSGSANTPDELTFITLGDIIKNADNLRDLISVLDSSDTNNDFPVLSGAMADLMPVVSKLISKTVQKVNELE